MIAIYKSIDKQQQPTISSNTVVQSEVIKLSRMKNGKRFVFFFVLSFFFFFRCEQTIIMCALLLHLC